MYRSQVVNPRLFDMMKSGNNSSRSRYNQRNRPNGNGGNGNSNGNDYRNRGQQQNGYQRQSRFSSAVPNSSSSYQSRAGTRFDLAPQNSYGQPPLPKQSYQQYQQSVAPSSAMASIPMAVYTNPSQISAQFNYPPPVLPVKN